MKFIVVTPESVEVKENPNVWEYLSSDIIQSIEYERYPSHYGFPQLRLLVEDNGIHQPFPYNRWGVVGNLAVVKVDRNGKLITLTPPEIEAVVRHLQDRSGGYLDPRSEQTSPFRAAFAQHGEPPPGYVPAAGTWFR